MQCLDLECPDPEYLGVRGRLFYQIGEYCKMVSDFNGAIKYALAYLERGSAYNAKGDYDSAISDFTETVKLDPKDKIAYFRRGLVYKLTPKRFASC